MIDIICAVSTIIKKASSGWLLADRDGGFGPSPGCEFGWGGQPSWSGGEMKFQVSSYYYYYYYLLLASYYFVAMMGCGRRTD